MKFTRRAALELSAAGMAALCAPAVRASDFTEAAKLKVGVVPYISSGPYFVARAKGYFKKVNLDVEDQTFQDGGLAIPSLVAGELDMAATTCNAGLFNTIGKGAPFRIFLERGRESPGFGSLAMVVSKDMHAKGFNNIDGFKLLKGQSIGLDVRGSIAEYLHVQALKRAGMKQADVNWRQGLNIPTMLQLLNLNEIALAELPVPVCLAAESKGAGKIVCWGDEIAPNVQIANWAANERVLKEQRSAAVRFAMVHLHSVAEFMDAAKNGNREIAKIVADATRLPEELVEKARPRWTGYALDGVPNVQSVMEQAAFWGAERLVTRVPKESEVMDLSVVDEARKRLSEKNPFN
jgi:NitT/TauT family transport system substrate-binding protein